MYPGPLILTGVALKGCGWQCRPPAAEVGRLAAALLLLPLLPVPPKCGCGCRRCGRRRS